VPRIYVTGHRSPDTDSIAAAIGYAELLGRIDAAQDYVPVRLGDLNDQTRWVLEQAGAPEPVLLPHILQRVRDVMKKDVRLAELHEPVRDVGLAMVHEDAELIPVVDGDGELAGVVTERTLARRYVRESREASRLDAPTAVAAVAAVLRGELLAGDGEQEVDGRVWVLAMSQPMGVEAGDVVVLGDREDVQRRAIGIGVALIVASNGTRPGDAVLEAAREAGTAVITTQLDSYVAGRMITLSAPCSAFMDREPLTVRPDDVVEDVVEAVNDVDYRAAVAVDSEHRPIGLVTRSDLVNPPRRKVVLVDHAEEAQSVPGIERAEIVEILDHHHIGSIETHVPVRATFDPVGSTATLVVERFRSNGMEPSRSTATMLLGAVLSDTVILNSPTATERDREVVAYLERVLALDPQAFGREMFERTSDLSRVAAEQIVGRDMKVYEVGAHTLQIAQVETVGEDLGERRDELIEALEKVREREGHVLAALMVTDIMDKGTQLYVSGERGPLDRAFEGDARDGVVHLPGVMSRKKQVAPKLLAALA
jgi:manganese-dependent inorganic pyrophosphatase